MINFILKYFVLINVFLMQSCTADIRTKFMEDTNINQEFNEKKGRELLMASAEMHGIKRMRTIKTYEIDFKDEYFGIFKHLANPYPETTIRMKLNYIPFSFDGQLLFKDSQWKDKIWGIQAWNTYVGTKQNKAFEIVSNKDIYFWLPTYQYFIEMPFRLLEADVCIFAGTKKIKHIEYNLVFISWKTASPQKDIDQYLAWINSETNMIDYVEFTVRDESKLIKAIAVYQDYKEIEGIYFPSSIGIKLRMKSDKFMHKMSLKKVQLNKEPLSMIRPLINYQIHTKH